MDNLLRPYELSECGRDGYPRAWHSIDGGPGVKHIVREAAGHRCVRCGHPYRNGEHGTGKWTLCDQRCTHRGPYRVTYQSGATAYVDGSDTASAGMALMLDPVVVDRVEAQWRILTVHHLRLGADAKRDLRWWNLAALCQRCHLQIQGKVVMERIWPWPHSDWFKPYAAGWYAWAYLGEDLTQEEVAARLDELLALEAVA